LGASAHILCNLDAATLSVPEKREQFVSADARNKRVAWTHTYFQSEAQSSFFELKTLFERTNGFISSKLKLRVNFS
jgi:hypothetical protein